MSSPRQSDIFKNCFVFWKVFGLWSGRKPNNNYKYYSCVYLSITLLAYNILLTLNLAYTPRKIEYLIGEVIFYFTEMTVTSKVFMIIIKRDKILEAFNLIDGKDLEVDDDTSKKIIQKNNANFGLFWKCFATMSHAAYSTQVFIPIILYFIFHTELELPISKYYFLTDEIRNDYFIYWFIYQSWGMYGHMVYNVTVDSFIAGLLVTAISQLNVLNNMLSNLKLSEKEKKLKLSVQEKIQMLRLRKCLLRYDAVLKYCDIIQDITNITMFIVFGLSSVIICVVLCGLLLTTQVFVFIVLHTYTLFLVLCGCLVENVIKPSSTESFVFLVMYLFAMTLQIFIPGYLGTLLSHESKELVFAAYCTEWIPRSESFKRSITIFVGRAHKPIQMTGLKVLPLSLATFTSIVKSAYSMFTLMRSFQE